MIVRSTEVTPVPRVLVIEDQKKLLSSLRKGLEREGYEVATAATGEDGYYAATTQDVDALVLDLMLPGRDGMQVLHDLRAHGFTRPVLILTARDSVDDRVSGLDGGADDYLVKPFAFSELLARLRRSCGGTSRDVNSCCGPATWRWTSSRGASSAAVRRSN
jgi:DNA-binding response OmpR family regulator